MLDEFFKVAYAKSQKEEQQHELHLLLKQLPVEDLYKLASGEVTKQAYLDECGTGASAPKQWIDRFKGTPLFDQAVALEQEEIQLEMDDLQKRKERKAERQLEDSLWELKDQIRLKKKLLELQAAQTDVTGQLPAPATAEAPAGPAEAQGAGAVGQETPNPEKTVKDAAQKVAMAEDLGRQLARQDFRKEAAQRTLLTTGDSAGRVLVKTALDMNAIKGLGQGAMSFLKSNRGAAIGTALGAAGGVAKGLERDPMTGQRSLLKGVAGGALGAAGGAALGHGAEHFAKALPHAGGNVSEALSATGRQMKYQAGRASDAVKGALTGAQPAAAASGAAKTVSMPPSTQAMAAGSAPTMLGGAAPTMNMPNPALRRPAAMPPRIPTGMINGSAFGG